MSALAIILGALPTVANAAIWYAVGRQDGRAAARKSTQWIAGEREIQDVNDLIRTRQFTGNDEIVITASRKWTACGHDYELTIKQHPATEKTDA